MGMRTREQGSDRRRKQEARLDAALAETFPASDPIAAGEPTATEPLFSPVDRKPPLIDQEGIAAARPRKAGSRR
jgi:hypothetical protein